MCVHLGYDPNCDHVDSVGAAILGSVRGEAARHLVKWRRAAAQCCGRGPEPPFGWCWIGFSHCADALAFRHGHVVDKQQLKGSVVSEWLSSQPQTRVGILQK